METIKIVQARVGWKDPHIWDDARDRRSILFSIYDPLVKMKAGGYEPCLASSWTLSDDALTWHFTIREDVLFHDGSKLSAKDVAYSLKRAADPKIKGEWGTTGVYRSYMGDATVKVLSDTIVEVTTPSPMADLPDLLLDVPVVPCDTGDTQAQKAIGSGPYTLTSFSDSEVTMESFKEYWLGEAPYPRAIWFAEGNEEKRAQLVASGEAHICSHIKQDGSQILSLSEEGHVVSRKSSVCVILFCNSFSGVCQDPRVRKALNVGLDIDSLIKSLGKEESATRLGCCVGPANMGYTKDIKPFAYDPELAKKLLTEAGYEDGLTLDVRLPNCSPDESITLIKLISQQYAKLGITVNSRITEDRVQYAENVRDKQIGDVCVFDSSPGSTFRVLREKINSSLAGPWWQGYSNPEVNAELDRISGITNVGEREAAYTSILKKIREEAPWVFLYTEDAFWGIHSSVENFSGEYDSRISLI